jgi:trehalose 6-phosphate synthase
MPAPDLVVVSNRGPVSFKRDDQGGLVAKRGAGGLVSCLGPAAAGTGALWISCAISDEDRAAADQGIEEAEGFRLESVVVDPDIYRRHYDDIANASLWFAFHRLYDLPHRPVVDREWRRSWEAYRTVNAAVADAVVEHAPEGATVLVQDYHLTLVGRRLAAARPDLRTAHFTHTPFADPAGIRTLPDDAAAELLDGMAGHGACGFHSPRWEANFLACCEEVLGRQPATYVAPAATDVDDICGVADGEACRDELARLDDAVGELLVIGRVDRLELSKNIARGFLAFEDLLATRPEWRERVVFVASVYPSREALPEYQAYAAEVEALVGRINDRWSTSSWTPVLLDTSDFFPRSVALLKRADVVLVNPIRDGLNLVAKEAAVVNERDAVLVLSREAGVFDEVGEHALAVNPFDVAGTSDALHAALSMPAGERRSRAQALAAAAVRRTPADWIADQLAAAAPA